MTPSAPRSRRAAWVRLLEWVRRHPGRFTYPAPPDFTGSVFVRHVFYHAAGDVAAWQGPLDEQRFETAAAATYRVLKDIAPHLWRAGETYPETPIRLSQLLADGEVDFAMSYHPAEASKMIHDGLYPPTVRTFVFDEGTIANTHFVAVPFNAADKEGAMVVADFLISPEAQLQKADPAVWGDFPAIDFARLEPAWRAKFDALPRGDATLPNDVLQSHQLPEPPSESPHSPGKGLGRARIKGPMSAPTCHRGAGSGRAPAGAAPAGLALSAPGAGARDRSAAVRRRAAAGRPAGAGPRPGGRSLRPSRSNTSAGWCTTRISG